MFVLRLAKEKLSKVRGFAIALYTVNESCGEVDWMPDAVYHMVRVVILIFACSPDVCSAVIATHWCWCSDTKM